MIQDVSSIKQEENASKRSRGPKNPKKLKSNKTVAGIIILVNVKRIINSREGLKDEFEES